MHIWLDTEFNEHGGALISMGLAAENGADWYAVLGCENPGAWVARHVMPILGSAPVSRSEFSESLRVYLAQFRHVNIIADWPADVSHFCDSLITGPGMRIATPTLTFEIDRNLPSTEKLSLIPHNALADAQALRDHAMSR